MASKKIPVSIITGYLGSGKTTLLKRIIDSTDKKIAILMNEFGKIAIDSKIIKGKDIDMVDLGGGCVCCSLTGEFEAAVKEIVVKASPDVIFVETTGVAEPDAIIIYIEKNIPEVKLDTVITVVDADGVIKYPQIGHTSRVQIEMADIILINKVDLVSSEQFEDVYSLMKTINSNALILDCVKCDINTRLLFGLITKKKVKNIRHDHLKKESLESFSVASSKTYDRDLFDRFAAALQSDIFRAKGFVKFDDGSYLFNYINGKWDFEKFEAEKTELVFIGRNVKKLEEKVLEELQKCEI